MRAESKSCCDERLAPGLVEVVRDAVTLAQIHQEWGLSGALREDTLEKWFHMRNKTREDYEKVLCVTAHVFLTGVCSWSQCELCLSLV